METVAAAIMVSISCVRATAHAEWKLLGFVLKKSKSILMEMPHSSMSFIGSLFREASSRPGREVRRGQSLNAFPARCSSV